MARNTSGKFGAWLAGYYDDFASARMVAEHGYDPASSQTFDHISSHHGNWLNGMAILNIRHTHCVLDRGFDLGSSNATVGASGTNSLHIAALEPNSGASNFGISEWLKCDRNRLNKGFLYEGLAQTRQIGNITQNDRIYYAPTADASYGSATGGYARFTNGYQTKSHYWVLNPGEHGTSARENITAYDTEVTHASGMKSVLDGAGSPLNGRYTDSLTGHVVYTSTATTFQWETVNTRTHTTNNSGTAVLTASASPASERGKKFKEQAVRVGWPIESLSGQPFLVLDSRTSPTRRDDTGLSVLSNNIDIPLVTYEGSLNCRGDKDVFTIRKTYQAFLPKSDSTLNAEWGYLLKVGFLEGTATMSEAGWSNATSAIELPIHAGTLSNTSTALESTDSDEYVVLDGTNWAIAGATRTGHTQIGNSSKKTEFTDATCDTTNTDATVTMDSTAKLIAGIGVQGAGIPVDATVASITNATTFELSAAATATATNVTLTFEDMPKFEYTNRYLGTYGAGGVAVAAEANAGENIYLGSGGVSAAAAVKANLVGANVFQVETGKDVNLLYDGGVGSSYSRPLCHPRFSAFNVSPESYYKEEPMDGDPVVSDPGDDIWYDIDIEMDFTNQIYHVFLDGKKIAFNRPFEARPGGGSWTATDMKGWELRLHHYFQETGSGDARVSDSHYDDLQLVTCIARAGLIRPISDNPRSNIVEPLLSSFRHSSKVNSTSTVALNIIDDNNVLPTKDIASASSFDNWSLLIFTQNLARPIWRGPINNIDIIQNVNSNTKEIIFEASDPSRLLQRELPIWDFGEKSQADSEAVSTLKDESGTFSDSLYFGVEKLRETDDKIGFEYDGTNAPKELEDQRTRLWSSHPIQLYNNEDDEGPNLPESTWTTGYKIIGFSVGSNSQKVFVHCDAAHGLANGDTVTIAGTRNYNGSYTVLQYNAKDFLDASGKVFEVDLGSGNSWVAEAQCKIIRQHPLIGSIRKQISFYLDESTIAAGNLASIKLDAYRQGGYFTFGAPATTAVNGYFNTASAGAANDIRIEKKTTGTNLNVPSFNHAARLRNGGIVSGSSATHTYPASFEPTLGFYSDLLYNGSGNTTGAYWPTNLVDYGPKLRNSAASTAAVAANTTNFFDLKTSMFTVTSQPINVQFWRKANASSAMNRNVVINALHDVGSLQISLDHGNFYVTATSGSTPITLTQTPFVEAASRPSHAVWMRDLPKSQWFKKQFGVIDKTSSVTAAASTTSVAAFIAGTTTTQRLTGATYAQINSAIGNGAGVAEFVTSDGRIDSFCYSGITNPTGSVAQLNGIKFVSLNHAIGTTVKFRSISNNYKHIWVLWADMRNNGNADADDSTRKNEFGLLYPTIENYELFLSFTDQLDMDGKIVEYASLKIGEDFDMWECDAEKEPFSTNSWSSLGSDSNTFTHFRNWEDKAGSFVIFDFSKFFNLNTEANGGRVGRSAGGRTMLEDLVIEQAGTPALIDDYWQEVCATPATADGTKIAYHPDHLHLFGVGSPLNSDIAIGSTTVTVTDASEFPTSGIGFIEYVHNTGGTGQNTPIIYYITWTGKSTHTLTGVATAQAGAAGVGVISQAPTTTALLGLRNILQGKGSSTYALSRTQTGFVSATVYSSLSTKYALRFQMHLVGYVKTESSGSLIDSDKARVMNLLACSEHYLNHHESYTYFDINNMPISRRMTTTQVAVDGSTKLYGGASGSVLDWDSFGSVVDARDKSAFGVCEDIAQASGRGMHNSKFERFIMVGGRDGRLDIRPTYQSFHAFTTANLSVSNLKTDMGQTVSNVRLYYNDNGSYIDHPGTTLGTRSKWMILNVPSLMSHDEAKSIAQSEYEKHKESKLSIEASVIRDSDIYDTMLGDGRYGYVGDTYRRNVTPTLPLNATVNRDNEFISWHSFRNHAAFPGACNAMDGNLGMADSGSHGTNYGIGCSTDAHNGNVTESSLTPGTTHFTWTNRRNYTFWGANSLTNAVQIVHVESGTPKTSAATSNNLRMCIAINHNATTTAAVTASADDVEFVLYLIDPTFQTTVTADSPETPGYSLVSTVTSANNVQALVFKHSGFHQINVPHTYAGTSGGTYKRMIVSINTEYLRALLRHRCGDGTGATSSRIYSNANDLPPDILALGGVYNLSTDNPHSIFPLGMRTYPNTFGGIASNRALYHAPQVYIVDDFNYVPGTAVTYTDANIGFSSATTMKITGVDWAVDGADTEQVKLLLDRDESRQPVSMASLFLGGGPSKSSGNAGIGSGGYKGGDPFKPPYVGTGKTGARGTAGRTGPSSEHTTTGRGEPITPNPRQPEGQRNYPGAGIAGSNTDLSGITMSKHLGVNNVTTSIHNKFSGKMRLRGEMGSMGNSFSILGQEKPGIPQVAPISMKGSEGSSFATEGRAFEGPDGINFPGNASSGSESGSVSRSTIRFQVPEDVVSDLISLSASITMHDTLNDSQILAKIECVETSESITTSAIVPPASNRETISILDMTPLTGANGPGNTLKVTLYREPGSAADDADKAGMVIHGVNLRLQRSSNVSAAGSGNFSPYNRDGSMV